MEAQTGQQTVDFASFLTMIPGQNDARNAKMEKKEILEAFQIYDRQKKGYVTAKELRYGYSMNAEHAKCGRVY